MVARSRDILPFGEREPQNRGPMEEVGFMSFVGHCPGSIIRSVQALLPSAFKRQPLGFQGTNSDVKL